MPSKVANQRGYVTRNVVRLVELATPHGRSGVALKQEEAELQMSALSSGSKRCTGCATGSPSTA